MTLLTKIENAIQRWFSRRPIFYAFIGGIGAVLFWRGVWHTADSIASYFMALQNGWPTTDFAFSWDGVGSFVLGSLMLIFSGLFVSTFLGNEITISGLRGEKKLSERTEVEVRTETGAIYEIKAEMRRIRERLEEIEKKVQK